MVRRTTAGDLPSNLMSDNNAWRASPEPDPEVEQSAAECIANLYRALPSLLPVPPPEDNAAPAMMGFGWWVFIIRTAEAIRLLHDADLAHEAAPLVRTLLHHVVALIWLAREPDAAYTAAKYQWQAKKQKLYSGAAARSWDVSRLEYPPKKPKGNQPSGLRLLDSVETLAAHVGLPDVYVSFMVESAYVHPSATGADVYFTTGRPAVTTELKGTPLRATAVFAGLATVALLELLNLPGLSAHLAEFEERLGVAMSLPKIEPEAT